MAKTARKTEVQKLVSEFSIEFANWIAEEGWEYKLSSFEAWWYNPAEDVMLSTTDLFEKFIQTYKPQ